MQKKSLLVALFCGALCLTGCLKNEESASVALVRGAKAEELKSLAALNNAKAAAEAVYAEAELTVAKAEAKLREANAALVLAQAETEKVRAELLKVRVALAEVKVDEEKVRLQMLEADLEQKLAEVEAAVAKAEAEKQGWINLLEHAIAAAEAQAITDAQAILEAEQALEAAVLKMEKAQADSAKKAADRYFIALNNVQKLEKELIETKAMKALVEAGAIQVRDAIYEQIDKIRESIEEKEALVEYLKEYQTMTPEQAEEALKAARTKLSEAYTAYKAAVEVKEGLKDALEGNDTKGITGLKNMTADFVAGNPGYEGKHQYKREFEDLISETRYSWAKKDGERGVKVLDEDGKETDEFIPLWTSNPGNFAKTEVTKQRYPDLSVYSGTEDHTDDFVVLETTTNTPVKVYFDNANKVLDAIAKFRTDESAADVKDYEEVVVPQKIEELNAKIAKHNEKLDLHKKYVEARKDVIAVKEQAFLDEIAANEAKTAAVQTAWNNWQEYMLVNYDGSRADFTNLWNKQKEYDDAVDKLGKAQTEYSGAINNVSTKADGLEDLIEDEAHAEGAYRKAIAQATSTSATSSTAYKKWNGIDPYTTAVKDTWNENFNMTKDTINVNGEVYNKDEQGAKIEGTKAAPAQVKYIRAKAKVEKAEKDKDAAEMAYWRHPDGSANSATYKNNYEQAVDDLSEANSAFVIAEDEAEDTEGTYYTVKAQYELAIGTAAVKEAAKAWNINFFGDDGLRGHAYTMSATDTSIVATAVELVSGKWQKKGVTPAVVAGTTQQDLLNGVKDYRDAVIAKNEKAGALATAISKETTAKGELAAAVKVIIANIKHVAVSEVKDTEKLEDYLDDTDAKALYNEYLAKKKANEQLEKAKKELFAWYTFNPDKIKIEDNPAKDNKWDDADEAQFSWMKSSYMVDYKAKMLDEEGKWVYIAEKFNELDVTAGDTTFNSKSSLAYKIEKKQAKIAAMPEKIEAYKTTAAAELKTKLEKIEEVRTNLMYFEPLEASYLTWIKDMASAEKALNEAKKAEFDAKLVKNDAQAKYDAAAAVANEGMWVYDPDKKIYDKVITSDEKVKWENDFTWITISKAIENIEGEVKSLSTGVSALFTIASAAQTGYATFDDQKLSIADIQKAYNELEGKDKNLPKGSIAELNFTKKVLEQVLKVGKVGLQIIVDAFDEEIAELNEKIDVNTAIANMYKAIMNGWLGIEENGETGPLDGEGEGDDEE